MATPRLPAAASEPQHLPAHRWTAVQHKPPFCAGLDVVGDIHTAEPRSHDLCCVPFTCIHLEVECSDLRDLHIWCRTSEKASSKPPASASRLVAGKRSGAWPCSDASTHRQKQSRPCVSTERFREEQLREPSAC